MFICRRSDLPDTLESRTISTWFLIIHLSVLHWHIHPAYGTHARSWPSRIESSFPERLASFFLQWAGRASRQPLLGQPDEKHRRGYEYCVIARLPRNKREPVTMTPFLSPRRGTALLDGYRRPTQTMNFKFSATMQIRKPRERLTYESRRGGNLPRITARNHGSDVLIARVNHFRRVWRIS